MVKTRKNHLNSFKHFHLSCRLHPELLVKAMGQVECSCPEIVTFVGVISLQIEFTIGYGEMYSVLLVTYL